MEKAIEMTEKEFRTMQLLELDMIVELDRVCRKHDINYCITCGTLLGAVRHKGYIPWDDDADIAMLREDYEKFKQVINELDPKICFFQDHSTDPEYLWGYGKLRRTGSSFIRAGQEHMKGHTGVFIDIFPLDDVPRSVLGQMLQSLYCFCLRKILWARVGKLNSKGIVKTIYRIISYIPVEWVYARIEPMILASNNGTSNKVRVLLLPPFGEFNPSNPISERYGVPKKWFLERSEYEFEDHMFYGTKDYHDFLLHEYGNYMTLPPEEMRQPHATVSSFSFPEPIVNGMEEEKNNNENIR